MGTMKTLFFLFILLEFLNGQINTEKYHAEQDSSGFSNKLGLSFNYYSGNTELMNVGLNLRTDMFTDHVHLLFFGVVNRGMENGEDYLSNRFFHLRTIFQLSKWYLPEVFIQNEFNKFVKLDNRNLFGGGVRFIFVNSNSMQLMSGLGLMQEYEKVLEHKNIISSEKTRVTSYLSFKYKADRWGIDFVGYLQPNVNAFSDVKSLINSELTFKFNETFSYATSLELKYDSKPPTDVKRTDIHLSNGFKVHF